MKKKIFSVIVISLLFYFGNLIAAEAKTAPMDSLIKNSHSIVYYYGADGFRYVFPNVKTYKSWFSDFSEVITVSDEDLAKIPLKGNVTYRPGVKMVKIQSNPKVYAVGKGGKLRWIKTEALAEQLYGADWNTKIDDIPVTFFTNYEEGEPIEDETEYEAETEKSETLTINENMGIEESEKPLRANTGVGGDEEFELEPDIALSDDVTNFTTTVGNTNAVLSWTNPTNDNFIGTKILRRVNHYPVNVIDGTEIYVGADTSYTDTGLISGATYYYKAFTFDEATNYSSGVEAISTPIDIEETEESSVFLYLAEKIGQDDAELVNARLSRIGFVLTEEFIDEHIIEYSPGYDADNDITLIGDPAAPQFLGILEESLDRLYSYSPELYQYAVSALRYIRGVNFGTRCNSAIAITAEHEGGPGMEINTYNWIYDYPYPETPLSKQPPVSGFLFIHEATHNKNYDSMQSGQIREITSREDQSIAFLAHAYYAKEYITEGQSILEHKFGLTLKEFVMRWSFNCDEEPDGYFWDWDLYVTALEKAGFPPEELEKLRVYLAVTSEPPVISNIQITNIPDSNLHHYYNLTSAAAKITWDTDKLAETTKFEYSLNSDLSSAMIADDVYFGGYSDSHLYIFSNLNCGETYYYRITSMDNSYNISVSQIFQFTKTIPDITYFQAFSTDTSVILSWDNPTNENFAGVKIMKKTENYPVDVNDGIQVYDGFDDGYTDIDLINETTYYYKAFTYSEVLNYSSGVEVSATPEERS